MTIPHGLDALTTGIQQNKIHLLYGISGSGKTTFGLSSLAQGLARGEHAALVTERSPEMVIEQAGMYGISLQPYLRSGHLMIFEYPDNVAANSARAGEDSVVNEFRAAIGDTPVQWVMIDTITPLLGGQPPVNAKSRFEGMLQAFRNLEATCFFLVDTTSEAAIGDCKNMVHGVIRFEQLPAGHRRLTVERYPDPAVVRTQVEFDVVAGVGLVEMRPSRPQTGARATVEQPRLGRLTTGKTDARSLSGWFALTSETTDTARVLVVQPDPAKRALLRTLLERNVTVLEASGAVEALSIVQRDNPDVVIAAYETRGASGVEIAIRLRQSGNSIPVILTGGRLRRDADMAQALEAGVDVGLAEPIDGRILLLTVSNLLRLSGFKGRLPVGTGLLAAPGRDEANCTTDPDLFCGQVMREMEYCHQYALPLTFFTLRLPAGRNWLEELAAAATMLCRRTDMIYVGARGIAVLLAEAESAESFQHRFRLRWKMDTLPVLDFPRFGEDTDVYQRTLEYIHKSIGTHSTNTQAESAGVA